MDNALNEKLDLSALHLGIISVGALLGAVVTLVVCILAVRIITVLLRRVLGKTTLEQRVSKYIVSTVRFVLWVVTVLIVAQQLGIPVTSLVALFSVVSLAVSLAVQNVLANVAGGLVLLVTKPFTVGDYIDTPSGEGTVREMSLTYTFLGRSGRKSPFWWISGRPGAATAGESAPRMRRSERNTRTASPSARSTLTRSRGWRGPRGSRTSQLWCCTGTERPWIPSSRPAQRQKSTVSFRKPWRNNGGFRYEQQSCL